MAQILKTRLEFEVASDAFEAGHTCDGQPYIAEAFYVTATDAAGNRWRHTATFPGTVAEYNEEGYAYFPDLRAVAIAKAERLCARCIAAGVINLLYWDEARPVYGSEAYQDYGQFNDWCAERAAA